LAERDKFNLGGAWAEVWPLNLCGQDRTTIIVFIPRNDRSSSYLLFLPIWRQIAEQGPSALPPPAKAN
jgi:hypothetical protein